MRVLVTGGAGFIGSNLCRRLLSTPGVDEVRVIDDLSTGFLENLDGLAVEFRRASILDRSALREVAVDVDAIVHLAALGSVPRSVSDPLSSHEANATGTLHVLEAARATGGAHVVLASSSSVYGANPTLPKVETMTCQPMSPYAVSKLATEQYAVAYGRCYDLPVLPFRFFNVYGPGQRAGHVYAAVIPRFVEAALQGMPLSVHGDGTQSRDFTYVGTVVDVITQALARRVTSGPTNLAFGTRINLLGVIELLGQELGQDLQVKFGESRPGDVKHSQADNALLHSLFPGVAPVELRQGVRDTVSWMRQAMDSA